MDRQPRHEHAGCSHPPLQRAFDRVRRGPGALGADIATLLSGSVRKGDFPAGDVAALDETVFAAYAGGLRDVGWDGDSRVVRLGYVMSLALRCWLVRDTLRNLADPKARPLFGRALDVPPSDVRAAFATLSRFLLDRADEARDLSASSAVAIAQRPVR